MRVVQRTHQIRLTIDFIVGAIHAFVHNTVYLVGRDRTGNLLPFLAVYDIPLRLALFQWLKLKSIDVVDAPGSVFSGDARYAVEGDWRDFPCLAVGEVDNSTGGNERSFITSACQHTERFAVIALCCCRTSPHYLGPIRKHVGISDGDTALDQRI